MIDPFKTDDPLMAVYDNFDEIYKSLNSSPTPFEYKEHRAWNNCSQWRRGFSHCRICKSKLMYELSKGHSFEKIMDALHATHPEIKNVRKFAQNVIRETTGDGRFDDYIVLRNLWKVRKPIFAPPEIRNQLKILWNLLNAEGECRVKVEKSALSHIQRNTPTGKLLKYVASRPKLTRVPA